MPREFFRYQRLQSQLLRTLSFLLHSETKDPGLDGLSLTDVELSKDLSVAKIYFSTLNPDSDPEIPLESLKRASGFLRSRLAKELSIRIVPELIYNCTLWTTLQIT